MATGAKCSPLPGHAQPLKLEQVVREFARRLKRLFPEEIAQDPRGFKRTVVHLLKRNLPPGPGRTPLETITKAIQLRGLGRPWPDVYCACIPGYEALGKADRYLATSNLRGGLRSRLNVRKKRRKSARLLPVHDPLQ